MRVVIATVRVPFVWGGAEMLAEELRKALLQAGASAEIIAIPFKWYPPERILDHMLACRLFDLEESNGQSIDVMIGLKFPAYLIPHRNKVLWILHQHRQAYDLWNDRIAGDLGLHENGTAVKDAIVNADKTFIPEARGIWTISRNVSNRLNYFCGINARPLYHPPPGASDFFSSAPESYLLFPSRLVSTKRQHLAVAALAKTKQPVRIKFAGPPDHPEYLLELQRAARKFEVENRVEWLGGISEEEKLELYACCLGVVYPPLDEDYGYVTLEAMLSAKPVIVTTDSGGPLEFVEDGINGLITKPTPEALADAMDRLWGARPAAVRWGKAGFEKYTAARITWPNVVQSLLNGGNAG